MLEFVDVKVADGIDSLTLQIKIGSFEVAHWLELLKVAEFIHVTIDVRYWGITTSHLSVIITSY